MQLISLTEAATICGVKRPTFRTWVDGGSVPAVCIKRFPQSRILKIDRDELILWIKSLHAGSR